MAGKNALEIVKRISKSLATSTGFETNLKHVNMKIDHFLFASLIAMKR